MLKLTLVGGVFAAAAGFYLAGLPFIAANQLKAAIEARDADTVVSLIDFESVRADLKSDLMASMASEMNDPFSMAFGGAVSGGIIDGLVQPHVIKSSLSGNPQSASGRRLKMSPDASVSTSLGFMRFVVTIDDGKKPIGVVFEPRGLAWKVVGLDVDMSELQ